jgi:hypothetical protein
MCCSTNFRIVQNPTGVLETLKLEAFDPHLLGAALLTICLCLNGAVNLWLTRQ